MGTHASIALGEVGYVLSSGGAADEVVPVLKDSYYELKDVPFHHRRRLFMALLEEAFEVNKVHSAFCSESDEWSYTIDSDRIVVRHNGKQVYAGDLMACPVEFYLEDADLTA